MRPRRATVAIAATIAAAGVTACGDEDTDGGGEASESAAGTPTFTSPASITNPYLPISEQGRCVLAGTEEGAKIRVVRTLLDRTERFEFEGQTVDAAIVEDREWEDGELVERTLDYFAQDDAGTVHYFGEDVTDYQDGKVVGHEGAFRYGEETDKLGVVMPADPEVGTEWVFEDALPITRETDRVVEQLDTAEAGGETYEDVIRVREFQEPADEVEFKLYARGFGPISEANGKIDLVSCS